MTKGLDGCLFIYDEKEWAKLEEKITNLPLSNSNARKFSRLLLAGATACEVDKQGRILLPANLRKHANLEKDVALVGVGARIEIWDQATWDDVNDYDVDEMASNMEGLGI